MAEGGLSMLQGVVLDYVAAGKSPRAISQLTGLSPAEVVKMAYDLLDSEIITDADQRRKLQVYRLEKIVEALWVRSMEYGEKDDIRNLVEVLEKLNVLLALNKEQDKEQMLRTTQFQSAMYIQALKTLITAFQMLDPDRMTPEQWADWAAQNLEAVKVDMARVQEIEQ